MKENNSITAEDIKTRILKGISEVFRGKTIYMKDIEEDVEQYAQAKLNEYKESSTKTITLEQLEEEVKKAVVMYYDSIYLSISEAEAKKYFKNQVLPKYKTND